MRRLIVLVLILCAVAAAGADTFKVGFAKRDVTPTKPIPMWGYGARHDLPGTGTMDPLFAKCVVIDTGNAKLAIMGLDIGRGPTMRMMEYIRKSVKEKSGVDFVMISGSHTHHGPAIELIDEPGLGKGKFDDAVKYANDFMAALADCINDAAAHTVDAKMGWGSADTDFNRNRQTKHEPKPRDPELAVMRFDDMNGKPIAVLTNLAAHATIADIQDRRWTSEWPGHMQMAVEKALGTNCFFMQGAAGDLSPNTTKERDGIEGFGQAVAAKVLEINKSIQTKVPEHPSIKGMDEDFSFKARIDLHSPIIQGVFKQSFFPEMLAMLKEMPDDQVRPHMTTILLNGELALVGCSGEFFSTHANRLKHDSKAKETFFFGYCNGHQMYFPTRAAIEEGGYGADTPVSWVAPGAGEEMIDKALKNIDTLLAK